MPSIPMHLITGFLGSGKTTFLKHYLGQVAGSQRIGIIQNEFADANIDSQELKQSGSGFEILEVNNGSVFCVCLLGSFIDSLAEFIGQVKPDVILLEASGMSDPLSIGQVLQAPKLKGTVFLEQVWCLVDAVNFTRITRLQTRVNHQIRLADTLIVNKIDLTNDQGASVIQAIRKLNPFAAICPASFAKVEIQTSKPALKFFPPGEKPENSRPDIESQVVKSNRTLAAGKLDLFLGHVQPGCLRCKGYFNLDDGKKVFVQGCFGEYTLTIVEGFSAPSEFIIIGNFNPETSFQKIFDNYCIQ